MLICGKGSLQQRGNDIFHLATGLLVDKLDGLLTQGALRVFMFKHHLHDGVDSIVNHKTDNSAEQLHCLIVEWVSAKGLIAFCLPLSNINVLLLLELEQ